jgi:RNA polymerase sigma-70 factor (ECF subfamily)
MLARGAGAKVAAWAGGDPQQFTAVFFRSVRNLCIDRLRRHAAHPQQSLDGVQLADREMPHPLDLDEQRQVVRAAIGRLPSDWRDALLLRVDGELSYQQIAAVLDCSKAQVRTWIYRARRQLVGELKDWFFDAEEPNAV